MLLVLIIALISTVAFYRKAKQVGLHPGKAASLPFIAAGILLICGYILLLALGRIVSLANLAPLTSNGLWWMLNLFLIALYMAFISRNWARLKNAEGARRSSVADRASQKEGA